MTAHGDTRVDPYYWLRDKDDPEVVAHLRAENAYTSAMTADQTELREELYREIVARIQESDTTVPTRDGGYWYYVRTIEGKQYPQYCRRRGSPDAEEEVFLDPNVWEGEHPFVGIGDMALTRDGRWLAYSLDTSGFRQYTLRVRDLHTGHELDFSAERVTSVVWAADGRTLLFTTEDDVTKRSDQLWRQGPHPDAPTSPRELVYEEPDERFNLSVGDTRDHSLIVVTSSSHTTSEQWTIDADTPHEPPRPVAGRRPNVEYYLTRNGDDLYLRTNDEGRNFRIVKASLQRPGPEHWLEVVSHRDDVMIDALRMFKGHFVLSQRVDGLVRMQVRDVADPRASGREIEFPDATYEAHAAANPQFETTSFRFEYESMSRPDSTYSYDVTTGERTLLKQLEVLGGYDADQYVTERRFATAADGTRVPVSIVRHRDTPVDGTAPCFQIGYGSYGFPYPASFSYSRISLLDRGFVVAIAHIRGGGELGKRWHDEGRMANKMNTFTDFIAVTEFLVAEKYADPQRLGIEGGSAGGLLMGAVCNLRPELYAAVISHVPFVDVLTTMSDESLPLTVGEYEEWGNPQLEAEYRRLRAYCPYSNLGAKPYPAMLVKTSLNDSQVMYWEPAKYVARLRTLNTGRNPVLLHVNMDGGHGGSSGRYARIEETALDYAWLATQLGATKRVHGT